MRIISKYKDYYDYLTGIYGVDNNIILDRRNYDSEYMYKHTKVYICDKCIAGWYQDDHLYLGDDLAKIGSLSDLKSRWWDDDNSGYKKYTILDGDRFESVAAEMYDSVKVNTALNCPILLECHYGAQEYKGIRYSTFPKLSNLGIQKVLPAHDIYVMLTNWLSKKDLDMPSDPTDIQRFEGRGFDKHTSFRNIK